MARPLPRLDVGVLLEEAYRLLLAGNPAVVVVREGKLVSIVTRSDLMNYYQRKPQPIEGEP
jgi:predicted transcriptional regulator